MNLRDEPGEDHQLLFALDHVVLEDVLQGVQLPPTDQFRLDGVILHQEAAGELLQAQELRQNCGGGDGAAVCQLRIAVPPEPVVKVALRAAQCDVAVLEGLLRQVEGFLFGHAVGDAVFLSDESVQVTVPDDLLAVEAAHLAVAAAESVEVCPEDGRI